MNLSVSHSAALNVLAGICLWLANVPAIAFDPFEFQVYGYQTVGEGRISPQLLNSFVASGFREGGQGTSATYPSEYMVRSAIEYEFGLTPKIDFAYYLNLAHPNGSSVQYAGSKFRFRGSLGEQGDLPVDIGWYAEVEWWQPQFNDDTVEIELMPTFEKDMGNWTFIINAPDLEKVIVGANRREVFELGYRTEARYRISHRLRLGLQLFGDIGQVNNITPASQQQQYLIPVVHTILPGDVRASFGLAFGLTPGSDLLLLKANFTFDDESQWD